MCAVLYAVACSKAPMIMITTPMKMLRLRPSHSPMKLVVMAPKKQPISYFECCQHCLHRWVGRKGLRWQR